VDSIIETTSFTLPITWESPMWIIMMGCEHERIHLETSSVLFRQLPIEDVTPQTVWRACTKMRVDADTVPRNEFVTIPGGLVSLGKIKSHALYGWVREGKETRCVCVCM
jgi:hypothetical protein